MALFFTVCPASGTAAIASSALYRRMLPVANHAWRRLCSTGVDVREAFGGCQLNTCSCGGMVPWAW
jgi:hypothetical protein